MARETDDAPGWTAIDAALRPRYGGTEPAHWGTVVGWREGGPDPLDGVSAYARSEPVPHWHYVTYGMSELYEKTSGDPAVSGWGFEFTFRVARDPAGTAPPVWAVRFLQKLGRYVFDTGNAFDAGHHIDVGGPMAPEHGDSSLTAAAFVLDPELGEIATPHGRVRFLQVIGLASDEYAAAERSGAASLLRVLGPLLPLFVTDVERASVLDDPAVAAAVRAGASRGQGDQP